MLIDMMNKMMMMILRVFDQDTTLQAIEHDIEEGVQAAKIKISQS